MQHIFITGVAGFIGSHLAERLLAEGYRVSGIDNFDDFYAREIKEQNLSGPLQHPDFQFFEGDLGEMTLLEQLPEGIDGVIHIAGKAGVRPSIQDPAAYIRHNISATQVLLEFMQKRGMNKLLFASSSSIYGNNKKVPFSESDDVNQPISPYAFTKKSCELMTHTYHHLYQLDVLNLRFFTVFGPRQRPDLAIHKFVGLIKAGKPISMFGDGSTARDYTYVDDLVQGLVLGLDYLFSHAGIYEIINLGNNQPVRLSDLISMLYELCEADPNIQELPMQPGDVDITFADIAKAGRLLGYKPQMEFKEGLRRFIQWYEEEAVRKENA